MYIDAISAMTRTWARTPAVTMGKAANIPVGPPLRRNIWRKTREPSHVNTNILLACCVLIAVLEAPHTQSTSETET